MLDREFLDDAIPNTPVMWQLASEITGIDLANGYRSCAAYRVYEGLAWLARRTEHDRTFVWGYKPDWRDPAHPHYDPVEYVWAIHMHGLSFKDSSSYLTAEGWRAGEPCWYIKVECGGRWYVGAEAQDLAVLRAIIVVHALTLQRTVAPKLQYSLQDTIKEIVLKFIAT